MQQIASAVNLIVQVSRMSDGTRKVTDISEMTGMEGDIITMQDIFVFERTGIGPGREGDRPVPRDRHPSEVQRDGSPPPACRCRWTCSNTSRPWPEEHVMIIVVVTFVVILALIIGAYWLFVVRLDQAERRAAAEAAEAVEPRRPVPKKSRLLEAAEQFSSVGHAEQLL